MTDFAVGSIGAGAVFRRLYAPSIPRCKDVRLVAVSDPAMPSIDGAKVYASAEEMLESTTLDGVIVLSPPALHAAHVALCAERGLRVLVEKPPAVTVAEVDAWPRPELITPAFSRRYEARYALRTLPGRQWQFTLQTDPAGWGASGIEPVERDLLPHAADIAAWVTGEEIVRTIGSRRGPEMASGVFEMSKGGAFSWEVRHGDSHIERLSLDGQVRVTEKIGFRERAEIRLGRERPPDVRAITMLLRHWSGSISTEDMGPLATVADARACAAVIEAVEATPMGAG